MPGNSLRQHDYSRRDIRGGRRARHLIGDNPESRALGSKVEHRFDEVPAKLTEHARRPQDDMRTHSVADRRFPGELACAINV